MEDNVVKISQEKLVGVFDYFLKYFSPDGSKSGKFRELLVLYQSTSKISEVSFMVSKFPLFEPSGERYFEK